MLVQKCQSSIWVRHVLVNLESSQGHFGIRPWDVIVALGGGIILCIRTYSHMCNDVKAKIECHYPLWSYVDIGNVVGSSVHFMNLSFVFQKQRTGAWWHLCHTCWVKDPSPAIAQEIYPGKLCRWVFLLHLEEDSTMVFSRRIYSICITISVNILYALMSFHLFLSQML